MANKKEEVTSLVREGVKAKLQIARVMLKEKGLSKSGKNDYAHFEFFELKDFIPEVNEIFAKIGLHSEFNITPQIIGYEEVTTYNENGSMFAVTKKPIIRELATLELTDLEKQEDVEIYEMETAPVMIGNNTKQNIYQAAGGRNTYYKRYLYMNALEIVEDDESDKVLGQEGVNYQQPQMTPYDFMPQPAQPIMQAQPVQNNFVANNMQPINNNNLEQVANNLETVVQEAKQSIEDANTPLSMESKMEIMQMVNEKGLNGAEIISEFCKRNNLSGTNDLLESHKAGLIALVNEQ